MGEQTKALTRWSVAAVVVACLLGWPAGAHADIIRGVTEIVMGVLQVPISTLAGTFSGPPIIGTVVGAVTGLIGGVGLVGHGALELAASGVSIAKMAAPYVLPFVL